MNKNYSSKLKAFSLIELSIVILIIGILVAGVTSSSRLIKRMKVVTAQNLTRNSPVSSIKDLSIWIETSLDESFDTAEESEGLNITNWYDINPQTSYKFTFNQSNLTNKPVYTDSQYSLGTYKELNGNDKLDYQYAISFWFFLDAAPPNTNSSYSKYTSLLNFGEKPNVLYNGTTNTLMITIKQKDLNKITNNKLTDFDENDNRILYKNTNMLLQKWNNIIINYNGGILDIFLNGELVKSDIGVVPYYTIDNLTIGEDNGIKGGICNVIYFSKALNSSNIYYLYNMVKNNNPPILNESEKTILK